MNNSPGAGSSEVFSELHMQAHTDLSARARGGIVIYLVVWLITAFWGELNVLNPTLFFLNTLLFVLVAILRAIHDLVLTFRPGTNTRLMYRILIALIFASAFHWGIMAAWVVNGSENSTLHYPYMIITAAFAIGGTAVLSISRSISRFYSLFIFTPTLVSGVIQGGEESLILVLLATFSMLYVLMSSRVSHNDYWKAITSYQEADTRAKIMEKLSITDPLTGLYNRMHFNQKMSQEWERCSTNNQPLSVLMIDLDYFKSINDRYGHIAGDECLKAVAQVLDAEVKRSIDTVARYGGEEFIVLLPDTQLSTTVNIAEKLVSGIAEVELVWNEQRIPVTCSVGCAILYPDLEGDSQALLIAADEALYKAKEHGRNRYIVANMEFPGSSEETNQTQVGSR